MSLSDDIAAVMDRDDITAEQKRDRIRAIRAEACYADIVGWTIPVPLAIGDVTIVADEVRLLPGAVFVRVSTFDSIGREIAIDTDHVIVNPPLLVADDAGDMVIVNGDGAQTRWRHDPANALADVLTDAVARLVGNVSR